MSTNLTTIAPVIATNGITAPTYSDVLTYLQSQYQNIYGSDVYLGNDSQDGQWLGIVAQAITDCNAAAVSIYNAFSPATAMGEGLSSVVKINGIQRAVASNSTATVSIVGVAGTTISNGAVGDRNNMRWNLPSSVIIPPTGTIDVSATCETIGAITARPGSISQILTPTRGWQSVNNETEATVGHSVELDSALRLRQTKSVAIPSLSVLEGIEGAISNLPHVTQCVGYDNSTNVPDSNGIPGHSIAMVVSGGDPQAIAQTILTKKTPGCGTYGSPSGIELTDQYGLPVKIYYFEAKQVPIFVNISIKVTQGYTSEIGQSIRQALVDYINLLKIGEPVMLSRLYLPANLNGGVSSQTFEVMSLSISTGDTSGTPDIGIDFKSVATCSLENVYLSPQ